MYIHQLNDSLDMRRLYMILSLLALIAATSDAQSTREVGLAFSPSDFTLYDSGRGFTIHSPRHTTVLKSDTLAPALPYVCTYIAIGPDEELQDFNFSQTEVPFHNSVAMAHNPLYQPTNTPAFNSQNVSPFQAGSYPDVQVEYTGAHIMNGVKVLSFLVSPFRYDTHDGSLYLKDNVRLSLSVRNKRDSEHKYPLTKSGLNEIKQMVANANDIDTLYPLAETATGQRDGNSTPTLADAPLNYLIVTRDSLKDEFQRLADWKTQKGCKAEVLTVESIFQNYQTGYAAAKIKTAIKDRWINSNGNLKYVLLGGSRKIVDQKQCYGECLSYDGLKKEDSYTDTYYACLEDIEWNNNNNGHNGDLGDSISLVLTVGLSRLPAKNVNEVRAMVDRILEYEVSPDTVGWKNELLMCAVSRDDTVTYTNSQGQTISEAERASELMYSSYIPTTWSGSKYRFYDTNTDNENGANYDVSPQNLQKELKKGYAFVNVMTHGLRNSWQVEGYYTYYYNYNADTLQSPRYTAVITEACRTLETFPNEIDNLGSAFLRNPSCGIISYYGSTTYNWYSPGDIGPGEDYAGYFLDTLLVQNMSIGEAMRKSKATFTADLNSYTAQRWNHLFLNMLGDPEMHLYRAKPRNVDCVTKELYHGDVIFHGSDIYDVCVMSRHDNGASAYVILDENTHSSDRTFPAEPNKEYLLTVTSPDCIPDRTIFGDEVKLQNESLSKGMNVLSYTTEIGSNVALNRDAGPVVVEDGSSVINSLNGVTIYNDFEVRPGASLEIITNN